MATSSISSDEIIEHPLRLRPQVVLLGAGASCAAFPSGDPSGRSLPLMTNLIDLVDLRPIIRTEAADLLTIENQNFEAVYAALSERSDLRAVCSAVEQRVRDYFSAMYLPHQATIYDRLVLALRPEDSICTFNWDPFLFDAIERNRSVLPSPRVHYLHGCVRVAKCPTHPDQQQSARSDCCADCGSLLQKVPLLYPVTKKDYANNAFINSEWEAADDAFANGMVLSIFGYGAPTSDEGAKARLNNAWLARSPRKMEHIEIIDRPGVDTDLLYDRWHPFTPTSHFQFIDDFAKSHISRWPRRASESWFYPMTQGIPCHDFPLPQTDDLGEIQGYCRSIAQFE